MAGHSKWANIKHRKAAQDAKRGKIFTKLIRELTVAAKTGSPVAEDNPRLRAAIEKARLANMSRETVERAIARGAGAGNDDNYDELTYEGYGPGGVAIMVECMTDNINRTVANVRAAFTKAGGNLGTNGSVAYLFDKKGLITFAELSEDQVMEVALEAGAEDIQVNDDGSIDVYTDPLEFVQVKEAMQAAGLEPVHAEVAMIAATRAPLDIEGAQKILKLIDVLEDLDDVQAVFHNADIPEEAML
ncbi:YebC/PmpR family DNA-binding transcriptional regulator [Balneatrix alpica]|uniref:Probable transcriptional regulatory protein ACFFLH_00880 n=1 Tax=Balneatrix alpica TaxID=75684 RepID=A0ABV5Z6R1_9GAMM|nr:YebC/PmpR family DNA-binding transcriptional regulator [Balneatrix alpica]